MWTAQKEASDSQLHIYPIPWNCEMPDPWSHEPSSVSSLPEWEKCWNILCGPWSLSSRCQLSVRDLCSLSFPIPPYLGEWLLLGPTGQIKRRQKFKLVACQMLNSHNWKVKASEPGIQEVTSVRLGFTFLISCPGSNVGTQGPACESGLETLDVPLPIFVSCKRNACEKWRCQYPVPDLPSQNYCSGIQHWHLPKSPNDP